VVSIADGSMRCRDRLGFLKMKYLLKNELAFPSGKRVTADAARYLSIVRLRPSLRFDYLIVGAAVRACECVERRWPAPRH
jgi:hypothetical protein